MICFLGFLQAVLIARQYTGQNVDDDAIRDFKDVLLVNMSFNIEEFPRNESDTNAYVKCMDDTSAQAYCPKRWKAMRAWIDNTQKVSELQIRMHSHHMTLYSPTVDVNPITSSFTYHAVYSLTRFI